MLVGEQIILRAWSEDDLPSLQSMRNNQELQRKLMTQARGSSLDQVRDWLTNRAKAEDELLFVMALKSSDQVVGYIQAVGIDALNGIGRLGICIAPDFQRKGYGGEAIGLFESYLIDVLMLRKLILEVLAENVIANRMYVKHGYMEVGRMREHFYIGDGYSDVVIMEKLLKL